jgi:hypothetical protein
VIAAPGGELAIGLKPKFECMLELNPKPKVIDKGHLDDFVCGDFSRLLPETPVSFSVSSQSPWLRVE